MGGGGGEWTVMRGFFFFAGVLELNPHEMRETNVLNQLTGFDNQD